MAGKKLARSTDQWGSNPRGRRRTRLHVRRAADRALLKVAMLVLVAIGLMVLVGRYA